MECIQCGNCKENQPTYYCVKKSDFVINENFKPEKKDRSGWKKGSKNYEIHRRISRKEIEIE
ncbi:hypothetical protein [Dethiothermospora halolimnae]|uniref:hypothetical protein n=1 Tax=Dethiothermospora halolimnae TaxID=3114390 RepID=UPI003CCBB7DA